MRYARNRMGVMQQVRFDPKTQQTIDVVLFVNGLPLATLELKNAYTGQTATNAIKQYMKDRVPKTSTPRSTFAPAAAIVAASVGISFLAGPLYSYAERAASDLSARTPYVTSVLGHPDGAASDGGHSGGSSNSNGDSTEADDS